MSLLWRDRIGVELSPQRVAWVRMARGLRANVIAKGYEDVMPQENEPLWQVALTKLEQMMRGEHFLSHNLWSAWVVWAVCFIFQPVLFIQQLKEKK